MLIRNICCGMCMDMCVIQLYGMCICLLVCTYHHSPVQRGCFECPGKCHHAHTHVALACAQVYTYVFLGIGALTGICRYMLVCQGMSGSLCDLDIVNMHQTCLDTPMSVYMHVDTHAYISGAMSMWQSGCVLYTCGAIYMSYIHVHICEHMSYIHVHTHMNVHMCP